MMWLLLAGVLLISAQEVQCTLPYDPDNYLEVYPDPRDPEVLNGRTPLHFALIQSLGGPGSQLDGSGTLAGVKVALDKINNDSSLLPGYTLHYTFTNSKCNRSVSLDALHSQIFHEPKKLAVIGSGCSVATEPTAEISHYYNITQISCVSSSGILGNRVRFPSYFQLLAIIEKTAIGYYGVIKKFGWRRIALIVQDENLWTAAMTHLKALLDNDAGVDYSEKLFNTSAGISALRPNPFDEDSRIFLLSMYSITALPLLCEAYHRGIRYPKYVVMTLGRYRHEWWRQDIPGLNCTADQRESVMSSSLAFTESYFLNEVKDANITTTSGITGREFFVEERKFVGQPPLNITYFQYSQYCHDATWTLAYALNKTFNSLNDNEINEAVAQAFNVSPPFRLEDFTYNSPKLMEIMFQHLSNTSFDGITGPVSFGDQGVRKLETIIIFQFRERINATNGNPYLDQVEIGKVNKNFDFMFEEGENLTTIWQGLIPYDGVPQKKIVTVHPALTVVFITLGCAGITFAIACIIFNFIYRNAKLIKIASTKLNYLIGIGAIILYVDTIFFVIPSTDPDVVNMFCNFTPWLTAIGYSLCYGTILAKMARVYYIFNNPSTNKKIIKDRFLILGVAVLVAIDLTILVTYTLVEGIQGNLVAQEFVHKENPVNIEKEFTIITNNFIYICDSVAHTIFLGILYGYKMLLQIIGLVLAFAIRKVKVKGLDDAKYIGVTIYVTSIVLAVTIVATYSLKDVINGFSALFCTGFLFGTSVILGLVFVPQMVGLYRDPKGESIFEKTTVVSSHHSLGITKETGSKITESEATGLRKRIKELENQVKELVASTKKQQAASLNSTDSIPHGHSLQGSQVAEGSIIKEKTLPIARTIWDTPEEKNQE